MWHLPEESGVVEFLDALGHYLGDQIGRAAFEHSQGQASLLANQHAGSKSIDGYGYAAVSATYAVANALHGNALEAVSYAAHASFYAGGGYAAIADRKAFEPEFSWQIAKL